MKPNSPKNKIIILALIVAVFAGLWYFLETKYYPPILMYHSIDEQWTKTKLSVSPEQFRQQMKFLKERHYNVVSLEQLADMISKSERIPHNTVVVTFDDGNLNNYTNAFGALREYGLPATIFLVSDWIGRDNFLGVQHIRQMGRYGIDFGSHTKTHPYVTGLSKEKLKKEIISSRGAIEAITGKPVYTYCSPFGGINKDTKQILQEAGFKAGCVTFPRDDSIAIDRYNLKRIKVSPGPHNLLVFRVKCSGYYTWFKAHRWKKKD